MIFANFGVDPISGENCLSFNKTLSINRLVCPKLQTFKENIRKSLFLKEEKSGKSENFLGYKFDDFEVKGLQFLPFEVL